jgi:hypothetical protein
LWVIFALLDPDPDPDSEYGSGSGSTDPIEYGSGSGSGSTTLCLGIRKLQFLIKNFTFLCYKLFYIFGHQNPGSGSGLVFSLTVWWVNP